MLLITCIVGIHNFTTLPIQSTLGSSSGRGRIIFSLETASTFRSILNEFVAEYQRLPPTSDEVTESERLKT